MSRQREEVVWVASRPSTAGSRGLVTSMKDVPSDVPMIAISWPVSGSVQPQMSLPPASGPAPRSASDTKASWSTLEHSYSPAMPPSHGTNDADGRAVGQRCSSWQTACASILRSIRCMRCMREFLSASRHFPLRNTRARG